MTTTTTPGSHHDDSQMDSHSATPAPESRHDDSQTDSRSATPAPTPAPQPPLDRQVSAALSEKSLAADPFAIAFEHRDSRDPRQWSNRKKWLVLIIYLIPEVWAQVISSMFAPASNSAAQAVGVSEAAMRTVQATYLYGLALGPIVVAPVSEDYGRKWILAISVAIIGLCQIPCALAGSIALMLPFRFIGGFFAATTFNVVGVVADLWDTPEQGWGVNSFAIAAECGAYFGTIIGGYIYQNMGWRWTFGIGGIVMAGVTALTLLAPETRGGVLLSRLAAAKRRETGDDRYYCAHERQVSAKTWRSRLTETLGRPIWMLLTEPIVVATSVFDGLNYMIIYGFVICLEIVYADTYGWNTGAANLPFLAVIAGALVAFAALPLQQAVERRAHKRAVAAGQEEADPEVRLAWLITSPLFPAALFWFAWTAVPSVHWSSSVIATGVFGFISHIIFVAVSDYTTSCYSLYAASAVGAQSLFREVLSGSFTLFTVQMYHGLGYEWASSLLGFLAAVVSVLPFLLYYFGPRLRARSPFCREQMEVQLQKRKDAQRVQRKWDRERRGQGSGGGGGGGPEASASAEAEA